jgi:hypothetical protein
MNGERHHPGRSAEFLSRLHDGELESGERAHFEAHRAHCVECRRAALEFEDALAMFRSARSKPPRADLAARILRKIQTSSRHRAPFSRRFRMDLGWVALVLTGIFALLLTTPIAIRREEAPVVVSLPTPVPGSAASDRVAQAAPPTAPETGLLRDERTRRDRSAPAPPAARDSDSSRPEKPPAVQPGIASERKEEVLESHAEESVRRPALAAEAGRAGGIEEPAAGAAAPLRLRIEAIDGYGAAPALVSEDRRMLPSPYRGREFVLLVDAHGRVTQVLPGRSGVAVTRETAVLRELEFEPGSRPRRLRLRFE